MGVVRKQESKEGVENRASFGQAADFQEAG